MNALYPVRSFVRPSVRSSSLAAMNCLSYTNSTAIANVTATTLMIC